MLRFLASGESHGKGLVGLIEGMPSGIEIYEDCINMELQRRQKGYGRGGRMNIESDAIEIISGVRNNLTMGSPISFLIRNRDYENWQEIMNSGECSRIDDRKVVRPRPGHADLAGAMKYRQEDMRNILERASARETAVRVAAGAFFKALLKIFDIYIYSELISLGDLFSEGWHPSREDLPDFYALVEKSPLRCTDRNMEKEMMVLVDKAREGGESLGGSFELGAVGVPPGLGSHVSWDRKLDAQIASLLMSIPAIKAVEIGEGIANARTPGSGVHDEIFYTKAQGLCRQTNRAGGIEGGISNGETIWARAYMKPIPTLYKPLSSVNTNSWQEEKADVERSDICAVPAAAVVGEAMLAYGIARAFMYKFSGDSVEEIKSAYDSNQKYLKKVWQWQKI